MFFKIIAFLFLILFIIKLIDPKVFPYFKISIEFVWKVIRKTAFLFFNSFYYAYKLLIKKTVYVIGMVLIFTLLTTSVVSLIINFDSLTWDAFYHTFKSLVIDFYVMLFFLVSYVLGLLELVKTKNDAFNDMFKSLKNKVIHPKQGRYEFDPETNQYKYKD